MNKMTVSESLEVIADFNEDAQFKRLLKGRDISEVISLMMKSGNIYNRRILRFFRWFCKWVPLGIMLAHWYGIYDFGQHPRPMFILVEGNETCYTWIYFMVYILPMVIILASRFFVLCWRYRIPFFYFFGVNSIHLCCGSMITTNEMVMPHFCLGMMIVILYVYGFAEMFFSTNLGKRIF